MKNLIWLGSSRKDFSAFPDPVKAEMGYGLYQAQAGSRHRKAKAMKGFGDATVIELVEDSRGDTYRAVYTVRFNTAVFVLHAFQKKSKHGVATPSGDVGLIERRLRDAESLHRKMMNDQQD